MNNFQSLKNSLFFSSKYILPENIKFDLSQVTSKEDVASLFLKLKQSININEVDVSNIRCIYRDYTKEESNSFILQKLDSLILPAEYTTNGISMINIEGKNIPLLNNDILKEDFDGTADQLQNFAMINPETDQALTCELRNITWKQVGNIIDTFNHVYKDELDKLEHLPIKEDPYTNNDRSIIGYKITIEDPQSNEIFINNCFYDSEENSLIIDIINEVYETSSQDTMLA